ncbi:VCBS repeat-containing protein [uncultured Aquimarina sp.]|uniref:VCBS repeat-containing protein n=1 Tax=uncultured Aquimarina sp. TaxID=575652 RepID=UPI002601B4BE|nr:VCBS repeat-containing protein [uncultured Aquimarina sp.]
MKISYTTVLFCAFFTLLFSSCNKSEKAKLFVLKNANETSINFSNTLTNTSEWNALNYLYFYIGAGVTSADFNNDGLADLYFVANMESDKLYLNKGNLEFDDITESSGINNNDGWSSGVTNVDINNDGLLDIYVSKLGKHRNKKGKNLLYVNQGINKNGIPTFKEEAKKYGLDIVGFSNQAAFLDYDLDGDLDLYVLHYSVYPKRTYGDAKKRLVKDSLAGDKFFINDNGVYKDATAQSNIFSSIIGYGLGVAVSDINNDGYPDIYVGNDFFENDYLYINQKNGTFKDILSQDFKKLGHTTNFSMGNDIADFNNDGRMDILSLDMLSDGLQSLKTTESDMNYQNFNQYLRKGYHPQFIRNTLQVNTGNLNFSDISYQAGISGTEWSWAGLFADLDNDGFKDIYITNGIYGATNDKDFVSFISNGIISNQISTKMSENDLKLVDKLPKKHTPNYLFRNKNGFDFEDITETWFEKKRSFSNGAVYTDLDNDGDLDLVTNNVNEPAMIMENKSNVILPDHNYLSIQFEGNKNNRFGIGTKVIAYLKNQTITQENYPSRGYISAVSPNMHIGLGKDKELDSLTIIWPRGSFQTLKNVTGNQLLKVNEKSSKNNFYNSSNRNEIKSLLTNTSLKISYRHNDNNYNEFNREILIPYMNTNQGPEITVGDINNDGREDFFIGAAKGKPAQLFTQQNDGSFVTLEIPEIDETLQSENTDNIFVDTDNDNDLDLIIVNGGNELGTSSDYLSVYYFRNQNGSFIKDNYNFKNLSLNASVVKSFDFDKDGDQDILIGSNSIPGAFGMNPQNYLFENDGSGNYTDVTQKIAPEFRSIGLVQDVVCSDINNDGKTDMIVAGYWMPIQIFINQNNTFRLDEKSNLKNTLGFWNSVKTNDIDNDGDIDIIAGNWGLNTRLRASQKEPITLMLNDFDDNGKMDPVITHFYKGTETVFNNKDELSKQMPIINKRHLSYAKFAKASFSEYLPQQKINTAIKKRVTELQSCYFINNGDGTFEKKFLPKEAQISCVNTMYIDDFNNDNYSDILLSGNNYELNTQLSRLDAFHGMLLLNDQKGNFTKDNESLFEIQGPARDIEKISIKNQQHYLVSINNDSICVLRKGSQK